MQWDDTFSSWQGGVFRGFVRTVFQIGHLSCPKLIDPLTLFLQFRRFCCCLRIGSIISGGHVHRDPPSSIHNFRSGGPTHFGHLTCDRNRKFAERAVGCKGNLSLRGLLDPNALNPQRPQIVSDLGSGGWKICSFFGFVQGTRQMKDFPRKLWWSLFPLRRGWQLAAPTLKAGGMFALFGEREPISSQAPQKGPVELSGIFWNESCPKPLSSPQLSARE